MEIGLGRVTTRESQLATVYVNDFNDDYHRFDSEPSDGLTRAVRQIRRRYKRMNDYMDALGLYNWYMGMLQAKHGGPELFKIKMKYDAIPDYIPHKPQLRNTAYNRALLKTRTIVSTPRLDKVNKKKIEELKDSLSADINETAELNFDVDTKDKIAEKIIKNESLEVLADKSLNKLKTVNGRVDYLEEFFRSKNQKQIKEKEKAAKGLKLTELMEESYLEKIGDTSEKDDLVFYQGRYLTRDAIDELKVYKSMQQMGWNSVKFMKRSGINSRLRSIVESEKKMNKKKKKKKRKTDDSLMRIVTDGGYDSFEAFQSEMLDMTSESVFGR